MPGITRATVLEICETLDITVVEKRITTDEMHGADAAFFCGTAAEVIGMESLDNISFKKNGEILYESQIQKAYKNLVVEKEFRLQQLLYE